MWHAPESKVLDNQRMLLLSPGTAGPGPSTRREGLFRSSKERAATHTGDWRLWPGFCNQVRCLPHLGVILRNCFGKGTSSDPRSTATADTHKHCAAARPDKTLVLPTASSLDLAMRRVLPQGTTLQVGPERATAGTSRYSSFRELLRRKHAGDAAKTGKWRCLPAGSEHVHCTLLLDDPREWYG